ncbi:hypothetical protein MMC06_003792 [Schaereria dolodes]|nr:hypothetical protein [Schaereria dolodes]
MASVFTYDPDPPKVSSPWQTPPTLTPWLRLVDEKQQLGSGTPSQPTLLADCGITKLDVEPQEGPTEYKLHLLLRPRRPFITSSTVQRVSGSHQSKPRSHRPASALVARAERSSPVPSPNHQSRMNRLQHLTTQLLWRLQQSSPYHSSSNADLVLPVLPEADPSLETPIRSGKLLPGLEESQGALYEIGVSDDGTFVGLTEDEMQESLITLRAMAASLGCNVNVLRNVVVGECTWTDEAECSSKDSGNFHTENLVVTEALVVPSKQQSKQVRTSFDTISDVSRPLRSATGLVNVSSVESSTEQLRVCLTGSTTSGKSSLLGTLSTSTLDNGRGKSRLSLLKHRHEIASGVTSSVAPELIGYKSHNAESPLEIINYASGNVSSWNDIHNAAEGERLVFLTDSAGHPRYQRTTVRGLVSWAPDWTVCCVAADDDQDNAGNIGATASSQEVLGSAGASIDLSMGHLDLCLKLDLPMMVVITKLDLASKVGLRDTLSKVLSLIKNAGRRPALLSIGPLSDQHQLLQTVSIIDQCEVQTIFAPKRHNTASNLVPIVLTSTVTGTGISKVHALLRCLPIFRSVLPSGMLEGNPEHIVPTPSILFHVDEVFTAPKFKGVPVVDCKETRLQATPILSGHLRYGVLSVGDKIHLGPFASEVNFDHIRHLEMQRARSSPGPLEPSLRLQASNPTKHRRVSSGHATDYQMNDPPGSWGEWQTVRIVSIRNLRLPVRKLHAGQVGTIAVSFSSINAIASLPDLIPMPKLRKGMMLFKPAKGGANGSLITYGGFCAIFNDKDVLSIGPGALVILYFASIRASAKVTHVQEVEELQSEVSQMLGSDEGVFTFDESGSDVGGVELPQSLDSRRQVKVAFQFVTNREWFEIRTQVFVMPGSKPSTGAGSERGEKGSAGLEGFVGRIVEVIV